MRPGILSGRYPERSDSVEDWLERALRRAQGMLGRLTVDRQAGLRKVAARIGRYGEPLAGLNAARLDQEVGELQGRFRTQGLSETLCMRAFALIREVSARTLGMRHYDAQLMGGWTILQGRLAEMETGEGKTLTATLAAATAALAGIPVHVLTVNEYLVARDAEAMRPLYEALGLTVSAVTQGMTPEACRAGYACDIAYCTNNQVAFDYLRDRLLRGHNRSRLRLELESACGAGDRLGRFMLRGLCFAIIDEADSVLIDEARTPLILTRCVDSAAEHAAYHQALQLARGLTRGVDFFLDAAQGQARLSRAGQGRLAAAQLPQTGFWRNPRRREALVGQALHALHLLRRDHDYLVQEDKVVIIDPNTGRTMPDRSWEQGLHQLVEAKEGCPLTDAREQLGRLTYQRFFKRYLRLGGMSGTAREVADELWSVYGLRVQRIPLHRPSRRRQLPTRVYPYGHEKWAAVLERIRQLRAAGRPVLVGTATVADSERISGLLTAYGIAHQVLNARQDKAEAEVVAAAGRRGQVTVATNMAGRGTDIPLGPGVAEIGGLHVIAVCRNEAKRIDRQLYGRCARQGDPGSHQSLLSLEDELVQRHCPPWLIHLLRHHTLEGGWFHRALNIVVFRQVQGRIEGRHREARRALLRHDRQTGRLLAFSGPME
jgi:preprotein translocase subunit SecA